MSENGNIPARGAVTKKYRARRKLLRLLSREQVEGLAKSLGHDRPWHAERGWLEARIQESWSKITDELEELVEQVLKDAKDAESDVQAG